MNKKEKILKKSEILKKFNLEKDELIINNQLKNMKINFLINKNIKSL